MTEAVQIAIPEPTSTDAAYNQRSLPQYFHAVEAAGGIPVVIPLGSSIEEQKALVQSCRAVLLPGSPADVDPTRYGQQPAKETAAKDEQREAADDLLLGEAFRTGKPLLGICFGLQSLNVWRRGTLIQHLPQASSGSEPDTVGSGKIVNHEPGRSVQDAHSVIVLPGSRLSQVLTKDDDASPDELLLSVNSSHHQAVDRPGEELTVVATSRLDGVIEALEGNTPERFVVAVQWHPERSYDSSAVSRELFAAFLGAARSWKPAAGSSSR
jgi:putative glutamine amidotransferase